MAYQLLNFVTESGIALPSAYLRIAKVELNPKGQLATVSFDVFADAASATAGKSPVSYDEYQFDGDSYTAKFAAVPGVDPLGVQPTNVDGIVQTQAYLALKAHPDLQTLLTGATAV